MGSIPTLGAMPNTINTIRVDYTQPRPIAQWFLTDWPKSWLSVKGTHTGIVLEFVRPRIVIGADVAAQISGRNMKINLNVVY